jgi:hypothetical protein
MRVDFLHRQMLWASPNPYLRLNDPKPSVFPSRSASANNFGVLLLPAAYRGHFVTTRRINVNAAPLAKVPHRSKN